MRYIFILTAIAWAVIAYSFEHELLRKAESVSPYTVAGIVFIVAGLVLMLPSKKQK